MSYKVKVVDEFKKDVKKLENQRDENRNFCIAGRVKFLRWMGKAAFVKIEDDSGLI